MSAGIYAEGRKLNRLERRQLGQYLVAFWDAEIGEAPELLGERLLTMVGEYGLGAVQRELNRTAAGGSVTAEEAFVVLRARLAATRWKGDRKAAG